MTEPIPSPPPSTTTPINAKSTKTQRKHKGKAKKAVSPSSATVDPAPTLAASSQRTDDPGASAPSSSSSSSSHDGDYGDFDYDAVKAAEGVELWLVRAPSTMKARNLRDLEIASSRAVGRVGDLTRKGTAYDVWALDPASSSSSSSGGGGGASPSRDQDGPGGTMSISSAAQVDGVGAEELDGLSVLLPRKRKGGKLYLAQKPITRHLVVSARPAKPARPEVSCEAPEREAYPDEVLTHRFRPYGDPGDLPREDYMDVDAVEVSPKEKKSKRKGGGETGSPKKRKAAKLAAS